MAECVVPPQALGFIFLAASCESAGLILTGEIEEATAEWTRKIVAEQPFAVPIRFTDRALAIYKGEALATPLEAELLNRLRDEMAPVLENGDPVPGTPHPLFPEDA